MQRNSRKTSHSSYNNNVISCWYMLMHMSCPASRQQKWEALSWRTVNFVTFAIFHPPSIQAEQMLRFDQYWTALYRKTLILSEGTMRALISLIKEEFQLAALLSALYTDDNDSDRDHKEHVEVTSYQGWCDHSQKPKNKDQYSDGPKHGCSPLSSGPLRPLCFQQLVVLCLSDANRPWRICCMVSKLLLSTNVYNR